MTRALRDKERNQTKLDFDEISEEHVQIQEENGQFNKAICDICFIRTFSSVGANTALYLCYICDKYVCHDCFKGHESHRFIGKSEKDGQIDSFLDEMMNESERKEMFEKEEVTMIDRVNVEHELDKRDCYVAGLCGLDKTRWVVCDFLNNSLKIFSVSSNILQRYIRFGSVPRGVTEIKVKREPTDHGVLFASVSSDINVKNDTAFKRLRAAITTFFSVKREPTEQVVMSTSDISETNQEESDEHCLLAVTLPLKRRILFIDVTQNPAVVTKSIKTENHCYSIDLSEDKIFTVCGDVYLFREDDNVFRDVYRWFVSVMSTDGVTIKTINNDLHIGSFPYIAVCPGRIYITDLDNNKVFCMNTEGKEVSQKAIKGSQPIGISVEPDTNKVYICAPGHHKLYRLDSSLQIFESFLDLKSVNLLWPQALCLYRDILYVGHGTVSTHRGFVTVVRVL